MKRTLIIATSLFVLLSLTLAACTPAPTPIPEPTVVLKLFGPDGPQYLTMADLEALPVTEGQAGILSSTGAITIPELYSGVAVKDLIAAFGIPFDDTMGVTLTAEDGYSMTYSYEQIANGEFIAYDPAMGSELPEHDPLTAILAYARNGEALDPVQDGTLRLMVVSETNNQVVDGHWTVKWINQVEIQSVGATWSLDLRGAIVTPVDRGSYQSCSAPACHGVEWQDENGQTWEGVPMWLLAGQVDDEDTHSDYAYNQELAEAGYTIDLIAADGYTVTLDSAAVNRNSDILVAYLVSGSELPEKYYPLRLVGPGLENSQMVGQITQIIVNVPAAPTPTLPPVAENTTPVTITGLVNQELSLTDADLHALETMTVTAEHSKLGMQTYQGVSLNALLEMAGLKDGATKLVFTASDGYVTEIDLTEVTACEYSLLAFTDVPGSYTVVLPDLPSQNWVKDLVSIEVK